MHRKCFHLISVFVLLGAIAPVTTAPDACAAIEDKELVEQVGRSIDRGLKWLRSQQKEDGSWENYPGITALVLTAYARSPRAYRMEDGPFIRNAVRYLEKLAKPDGGIYDRDLPAYNTAVSIMALCSIDDTGRAGQIRKARDFLRGNQSDEGEGYNPGDKFYGGIGYGNDERPDLSNLQFALESLHMAGLPKDDPTWAKAVKFLERCQNRSESNDQSWAANDGGFVYHPGLSMAEGTKSYGSMTVAGIKSFIYAHLDRNDPRLVAALDWIRGNYTLDENPGLGPHGLYYYYHTFAKAFRVYGEPVIVDKKGEKHRWADELARVLLARQHEDGYWVNTESSRWWQDNKVLVTSQTILALEEALAKLGEDPNPCPSLRSPE